jgi:hypothetical protein
MMIETVLSGNLPVNLRIKCRKILLIKWRKES